MKKNLFRFATLLVIGAMAAFSCGKDDNSKENNNNNNGPDDGGDDNQEEASIVIDGDFED